VKLLYFLYLKHVVKLRGWGEWHFKENAANVIFCVAPIPLLQDFFSLSYFTLTQVYFERFGRIFSRLPSSQSHLPCSQYTFLEINVNKFSTVVPSRRYLSAMMSYLTSIFTSWRSATNTLVHLVYWDLMPCFKKKIR